MIGFLSKIQRYSLNDGPGIRTTVFMKGCNLNCKWCANPELIDTHQSYLDNKPVGQNMNVDDLVAELIKDKDYYIESSGGITFSGGEPLLQVDFIKKCILKLKEEDIDVAVDTALHVSTETLEKLVEFVDLWIVDLKTMNNDIHQQSIGVSNQKILENIKWLSQKQSKLWFRCIAVNQINSSIDDLRSRLDFINQLEGNVERVDIVGYHQLGVGKYQKLNKKYLLDEKALLDTNIESNIENLMTQYSLNIHFERGI